MLFSTPFFCFAFFPAFFLLYFLVPAKRVVLLAGSLLFYAWGEPVFLFVVLASSVLDWLLGWLISRRKGRAGLVPLALGIAANLGVLVYTKYAFFALTNWNYVLDLLAQPLVSVPKVALPLGVSFIVFEKITYLVDIRRGVANPARSLLDYLNYVFLFPKLLAGPIVKYHDIAEQLTRPSFSWRNLQDGILRFVFGLGKKVLLGDQLGAVADSVFSLNGRVLDTGSAWLGLLCFGLQIYFDFSGYSDMAIGMGRMLGFRLLENFNNPYLATSVSDFWKRWHISLTSWIREYLYIPLGGNRVAPWRIALNLLLCFLLSGLWHGASWNFVAWGLLHGGGIAADRYFWQARNSGIPTFFRWLGTTAFVFLAWTFFRVPDLKSAVGYLAALFGRRATEANAIFLTPDVLLFLLAGLALVFLPLVASRREADETSERRLALRAAAGILIFVLCSSRMALGSLPPFIYFQF